MIGREREVFIILDHILPTPRESYKGIAPSVQREKTVTLGQGWGVQSQ